MIQWCFYEGGFWVRVFGRGVSCVNRKVHPFLMFSVRNGRRTVWLFHWTITWLPKDK